MKIPEKMMAIGGSILLVSLFVFGLRAQATNLMPRLRHPISSLYQNDDDVSSQGHYNATAFNNAYDDAKEKGWTTGTWGSTKYYVDDNKNMNIGSGNLTGSVQSAVGSRTAHDIKSIDFQGPVQAPQNSGGLLSNAASSNIFSLSNNPSLTTINNIGNLQTDNVQDMFAMFAGDTNLKSVDLTDWNMSKVNDMGLMFSNDTSLTDIKFPALRNDQLTNLGGAFHNTFSLSKLDLSQWNIGNSLNTLGYAFDGSNISNLRLDHMNTQNVGNMYYALGDMRELSTITLGDNTRLYKNQVPGIPNGEWKNGNRALSTNQLMDGQSHPGTWSKQ